MFNSNLIMMKHKIDVFPSQKYQTEF